MTQDEWGWDRIAFLVLGAGAALVLGGLVALFAWMRLWPVATVFGALLALLLWVLYRIAFTPPPSGPMHPTSMRVLAVVAFVVGGGLFTVACLTADWPEDLQFVVGLVPIPLGGIALWWQAKVIDARKRAGTTKPLQ